VGTCPLPSKTQCPSSHQQGCSKKVTWDMQLQLPSLPRGPCPGPGCLSSLAGLTDCLHLGPRIQAKAWAELTQNPYCPGSQEGLAGGGCRRTPTAVASPHCPLCC
jgi:hypothetical protein